MRRNTLPRSDERRPVACAALSESSFRYFLTLDRRRAERWNRSLLLVLVTLRREAGRGAMLTDDEASMLFSALDGCLRDIDIVGWYRQGRLIAGLLAQPDKVSPDVPTGIATRISAALRQHLSVKDAGRLRVRVVTLGGAQAQVTR
jgi:hypothetical protein